MKLRPIHNEKSWQLMGRLCGSIAGKSATVAKSIGVSLPLVHKWQEPPVSPDYPNGSGAQNPLDRVVDIGRVAVAGGKENLAREMVGWICSQFGGHFCLDLETDRTPEALMRETLKLISVCGDLSAVISDALADSVITTEEFKRICNVLNGIADECGMVRTSAKQITSKKKGR